MDIVKYREGDTVEIQGLSASHTRIRLLWYLGY